MVKSSKDFDLIPSEKLQGEILKAYSTKYSHKNIDSVKSFRSSYESIELLSQKNEKNQTQLLKLKEFLCIYLEMSEFLDYTLFEIWEKHNTKEISLDNSQFSLSILAISVLDLLILEYINGVMIGESALELKKILFLDKDQDKIWFSFKYSNEFAQIKEKIEEKTQRKKLCLKNNVENIQKYSNMEEKKNSLERFIKEINEDKGLYSEYFVKNISEILVDLLENLVKSLENYQNETILKVFSVVLAAVELGNWFFWDLKGQRANLTAKFLIDLKENENIEKIKTKVIEFKKIDKRKLKENLVVFIKNFKK